MSFLDHFSCGSSSASFSPQLPAKPYAMGPLLAAHAGLNHCDAEWDGRRGGDRRVLPLRSPSELRLGFACQKICTCPHCMIRGRGGTTVTSNEQVIRKDGGQRLYWEQ